MPLSDACRAYLMRAVVSCVIGTGMVSAGTAQAEKASFDVYLLGVRAGTLSYDMTQTDTRYAVTGKVRSSGLLSAVNAFRMDASAEGRRANGRYLPQRYSEDSKERNEVTKRTITYSRAGVPTLNSDEKKRDYWVPAAAQAGALDPMTALYELLRDRTGANPCVIDARFGDGARTGRIASSPQEATASRATCRGVYERTGGFSEKELREGTRFPFILEYARSGDVWELASVRIHSVRGRARIERR